jgi:hypothetical protein
MHLNMMSFNINSLWVRLRPYFTVATLAYTLLGGVFGSIPLLSLLQRMFLVWNWHIELLALPKLLLAEYQRLRTAALKPVIDLLKLAIPIPIPDWVVYALTTWVADVLTIYMLFAISVFRGSIVDRRFDRIKFNADPEKFRQQLRAAAALHGRNPENLVAEAERGIQHGIKGWFWFLLRNLKGSFRWPFVIKRNLIQLHRGIATDLASSRVATWSLMLASMVLGAIVYLLGSLIAGQP